MDQQTTGETRPLSALASGGRSPVAMAALLLCAAAVAGVSVGAVFVAKHPASAAVRYWPFVILGVSIGLVVVLIAVVRLHAFLALVAAAISVGLMALPGTLPMPPVKPGEAPPTHWVAAVEDAAIAFGGVAGGIGIIIALASVIGLCLLESGSADKVVRRFLAVFGERWAGWALLLATYIISIPIFFDTIFMLLVPIAQALWLRTRRDYMLYIMAICCAGVITHSMAIPHPGPLAMATELRLDVGLTIGMGLASGLIPLLGGWMVCLLVNRFTPVDPPNTLGADQNAADSLQRPESELPSFAAAITPIVLPVVLIAGASILNAVGQSWEKHLSAGGGSLPGWFQTISGAAQFLGNRHIALIIGTVIAIGVLMRQRGLRLARVAELLGPPLETAGVIILITSAGGAFGVMLRNAGVQGAVKAVAEGTGLSLIVLGWSVALVIRVAQGSATVAMLTTAGMMSSLMLDAQKMGTLPYHPVYLFLAIGYGAFGLSWMNDSGFWVVGRLSGLTERQTLRSWTVVLTLTSVMGLLTTLGLAAAMPMRSLITPPAASPADASPAAAARSVAGGGRQPPLTGGISASSSPS